MKLRHTESLCSRQIRLNLVSSQGELNCLDGDFLRPSFVLHQLLCLAGFANPLTGTLAGNGLELTESTDHFQSLRKLFKEVQAELQLNLLVNRLKKDINNQTINECIELKKSYTSENIWEEVSWPSCVCNQNPWYAHHSKPAPLYAHHSHTHHKCVPKEQDFSRNEIMILMWLRFHFPPHLQVRERYKGRKWHLITKKPKTDSSWKKYQYTVKWIISPRIASNFSINMLSLGIA